MIAHYHSSVRTDILPLVPQSGRLLDIGGGTGATALQLKQMGKAVEVGVLDRVVQSDTPGLDFTSNANLDDAAEVETFLAAAGPFDTILLLDVLEHLIDPWALVDHCAQHVAPGGVLIASVPNIRYHKVVRDLLLRGQWDYVDSGILDRTHLRFFVKETAIALLNRPGLTIDRVEKAPIGSRKWRLFNTLTLGIFRDFFTLQYFIVARKAA